MKSEAIKYGAASAGVMIAYFVILQFLGLHKYPIFSAMNGVFIGAGIFYALRDYKRSVETFKYQDGFQLGIFTGALATIIFGIFMSVYIFMIDQEFATAILDSWGLTYNKGSLALIISFFMMGFSTTFVLTLAFMQLMKESWNPGTK